MTATDYRNQPQVILVNEHDEQIGIAEKLLAHEQNLLHRAFSVFIFRENDGKELLLQQRALHKYHSPGLWTNTCCSHPTSGETTLAAAKRRLYQELGLSLPLLTYAGKFHYRASFENGLYENEIDHVFIGEITTQNAVSPNKEEINSLRWITLDALHEELLRYPEKFTPWFSQALALVEQ